MPKFNMNWLYILVLISLAVMFFAGNDSLTNSSASAKKDYTTFVDYVNKGYAARVVVNKKASTAKMYVKPEFIRDVFKASAKQVGTEPFINVEIGSVDNLENFLNQAMKEKKIGSYSYDNRSEDGFMDIVLSFLPWIIFIVIWFWLMNRMGGGAGGGGGIFNVGKSKAKLYEKSSDMGITFKDVAGQAGLKAGGAGDC